MEAQKAKTAEAKPAQQIDKEVVLSWLNELDDQLATAKVISSRREQDLALENISQTILDYRTLLLAEEKTSEQQG